MAEMRQYLTKALIDFAKRDERLFVLDADLMTANGTREFKQSFPDRCINLGVAEANMVGVAAGLSVSGKIPVAGSFACFSARRAFDQFFVSGAYAQQNIKLIGSDPGITAALNGGTHMCFEDIGLMRTIPGITICDPCDGTSLYQLMTQCLEVYGCTYLRFSRKEAEDIYPPDATIKLGKGSLLRDGSDVCIIAAGVIMVPEALKAADLLLKDGIDAAVIDMHTIKPLDEALVLKYAAKTGKILTCENHQRMAGLGAAVAEILAEKYPISMYRVGVKEQFGQVGSIEFLKEAYGFTAENIYRQIRKLLGNVPS